MSTLADFFCYIECGKSITPSAMPTTIRTRKSNTFILNIIGNKHRWACLLKQQSSITIYNLPTKENKLQCSVSVCSKQMEVCHFHFPHLQPTNGSCRFHNFHFLYTINTETELYIFIYAAISKGKRKRETQVIFLHLFTVRSVCKRKFVVCPFVEEKQMEVIRL
jgi:hypothetical protein